MKFVKILILSFLIIGVPAFAAEEPVPAQPQDTGTAPSMKPGCQHGMGSGSPDKPEKTAMRPCPKMKEEMDAMSTKIDALMAEMQKEKGNKKVDAMAKLIEALVAQNKQLQNMATHQMMVCEMTRCKMKEAMAGPMGCCHGNQPGDKPGCTSAKTGTDQ